MEFIYLYKAFVLERGKKPAFYLNTHVAKKPNKIVFNRV
jgi:hypothetical protein